MPNTIRRIASRKLYIGIFETAITDKITHRPELQIISVGQFERVQALIQNRAGQKRDLGRRGKYLLTGFLCCATCGGAVAAAKRNDRIFYQCVNRAASVPI